MINLSMKFPKLKGQQAMVQVWPKNDMMRKLMKHPTAGGFSSDKSLDPAVWPDDSFTMRRILNGDVLVNAPEELKVIVVEEAPTSKRAARKSSQDQPDGE